MSALSGATPESRTANHLFIRIAKLQKQALVSYLYTSTFGSASVPLEPPLSFGSHRSKLVERIRKQPCEAGLTQEEFIKIVCAPVPDYY